GAVLLAAGLGPLYRQHPIRWWAVALGVASAIAALAAPRILEPLLKLWMALARVLSKIVNPIALSILFYVIVFPCSLLLRLFRADLLHLRRSLGAVSYWIEVKSDHEASMADQF